jgi:MOSC domain-containing protein YiiM
MNRNLTFNRIGGVMIIVLASGAVDRGFELDRVKPKTIQLVSVASPLSTNIKDHTHDAKGREFLKAWMI